MKKPSQVTFILSLMLTLLMLSACQTKSQIEERDRRIFALQTRLLKLEKHFWKENQAASKSGENISMSLAESQNQQEEVLREFQSIKGELETLRHFTGLNKLNPDQVEPMGVAKRLTSLENKIPRLSQAESRLDQLDKMQNDILNKLEELVNMQASLKKASSALAASRATSSPKRNRAQLSSLKDTEKAYNEKRYLHVVEDIQHLKNKAKKQDHFEISYLHAQSLFKLGRISDAALAFDELLKSKEIAKKASKVYLRLGDCFRLLGDKKLARIYYEELLSKYPSSAEVSLAEQYLDKLKTKKI